MKQAIEYLLFRSGVSNYRIAKATGISQVVLSKYVTGKSDVGRMTLDNAIKIHNYFKEMLIMSEKRFGTVKFEGKEYILTMDAVTTGRQLNNGQDFNDKSEGEIYEFEMSADAIDEQGKSYTVYWIFENEKGEGGKDLDEFDYNAVYQVKEND